VQRADTSLPGTAAPISGFEAPRAAADAISTPVARAPHGAAAMQVAEHISRTFHGKSSSFEVRLDPAELGRVDVKISVDHEKRVTASVSADNPQTLTDLRGAAREIERALNEAGLNLADDGLSFEMNQRQAHDDQLEAGTAYGGDAEAGDETAALAAKPFGMQRWASSGVDVWA
jgi:flagellar hook-length control protein FliK